jgi:hypothetical protein
MCNIQLVSLKPIVCVCNTVLAYFQCSGRIFWMTLKLTK